MYPGRGVRIGDGRQPSLIEEYYSKILTLIKKGVGLIQRGYQRHPFFFTLSSLAIGVLIGNKTGIISDEILDKYFLCKVEHLKYGVDYRILTSAFTQPTFGSLIEFLSVVEMTKSFVQKSRYLRNKTLRQTGVFLLSHYIALRASMIVGGRLGLTLATGGTFGLFGLFVNACMTPDLNIKLGNVSIPSIFAPIIYIVFECLMLGVNPSEIMNTSTDVISSFNTVSTTSSSTIMLAANFGGAIVGIMTYIALELRDR